MPSLDGLLGRQSLKDRIASLEAEVARLESQLTAEQDRRRDAVRDKQEAQERLNTLKDRIAGLEGELERHEGEETERSWTHVTSIRADEASELVSRLQGWSGQTEQALSAAIGQDVPAPVRSLFDDQWPLIDDIAPCLAYADDLRILRVVLDVPNQPDPFDQWGDTFHIAPEWLIPQGPGLFALVRADLFAMGRYDNGTLKYLDGFEADIMGNHSKGGFSQARFERRRDEQIDSHVARVRESLTAQKEEDVILVGDRRIVSRLDDLATTTDGVAASGEPRTALETAFRDYWTTRVYIP